MVKIRIASYLHVQLLSTKKGKIDEIAIPKIKSGFLNQTLLVLTDASSILGFIAYFQHKKGNRCAVPSLTINFRFDLVVQVK